MHIKFLDHGKGDASFASAYVLDEYDHKGNLRAGVEVLRGDANTFNHACSANPHEWKYTSGVIAWSKDDNPNPEEIREVLDKFEKHAFAGLDKSQYHLFAVLHTDDDGSKHIHVLVPRMDLVSGKSLNIAPPLHHHHFDPLRDKLNLEKGWSRPDDILLAKFTQEPNHVAKINSQAEKLLPNFEKLKKNQLRHVIDNHIRSLLGTEIQDRSDIIRVLRQLDGVKEVTNGKHVTVVLNNDSRHRMKGAFYDENFELGAYRERLQRAAESGTNEAELRAAIKAADELLELSRTERATYNRERYPIERLTEQNHSHGIDLEQPELPSSDRSNSELSSAIRCNSKDNLKYRFIENPRSFCFSSSATGQNRPSNQQHFNRSEDDSSPSPRPSEASDQGLSKRNNRNGNSVVAGGSASPAPDLGEYSVWSADAFNQLVHKLSVRYELKNNQRTERNDPAKLAVNTKPNQLTKHFTEINNEDRNRSVPSAAKRIIESTKRIISGTKRIIDAGNQFVKDHLEFIQETRARLEQQNQRLRGREQGKKGFDFSDGIGIFKARAREFFSRFSAEINSQFQHSISKIMDEGLRRAGLSEYAKKYCANGAERGKDAAKDSSLEGVADACSERLQQRNWGDEYLAKRLKDRIGECNDFGQELDRLATEIRKIRPKPKPATDFETLRYDIYYRQYTSSHREFSAQQDYAYQNGRKFDVIHIIKQKSEKLKDYINQARNMLKRSDYELIEKIIKNDERMLKYLKCDAVLESQNVHLKTQRSDYRASLDTFEEIKATIEAVKSSKPKITPQSNELVSDQSLDLDLKPKSNPKQDFDLNF